MTYYTIVDVVEELDTNAIEFQRIVFPSRKRFYLIESPLTLYETLIDVHKWGTDKFVDSYNTKEEAVLKNRLVK